MLLETLKKGVEGVKRIPIEVRELETEFTDSSYKRIKAHYRQFERTWASNHLEPTFSEKDFSDYIESVFALRCTTISESPKDFGKFIKRCKIPALLYLTLENLGRVEVKESGLILVPKWVGKLRKTKEELESVSIKLQELEDLGHEMARGLPMSIDGSVDFMMLQNRDDGLIATSLASTHPVFALLRTTVKMASFQDLAIPRIFFLEQGEYDIQYETLIRGGR